MLAACSIAALAALQTQAPASPGAVHALATNARLEALLAACDATAPEETALELLREREFVPWVVRVRLDSLSTGVEWTSCALDAAGRALRSCASLTRDEIVAQLFEVEERLPFAAAMELLAELGDERDLVLLVDWATTFAQFEEPDDLSNEASAALRKACGRLAQLSAVDARIWRREFERAEAPLRVGLVRGLADCGSNDALARLAEQLGEGLIGDSILLVELARAARREDRRHAESLRRRVREQLTPTSATRREAALCAGALGDEESVATLVALLDDASAGVRANAHWSLQHVTGRRMPASAQSWSRWLDGERQWWEFQARELLGQLDGAEARARVAAAGALVAHRFPRHSLAEALATALPLNDRAAASIVLAGLRNLHSADAIAPLERAREQSRDEAVREGIGTTLAALRASSGPSDRTRPSH